MGARDAEFPWRWRGAARAAAALAVVAVVAAGSPQFLVAVFSLSSLLLLRCLRPPPPSRPPASPLHRLRFTGSPYLRRSVWMVAQREGGGGGFRPHGQAKRGVGGLPAGKLALWLRGEAGTSGSSCAVMLMLLSGRRNRQWDRSLPGAFPACTAGARSQHFQNGGLHGCALPVLSVVHSVNKRFLQGAVWLWTKTNQNIKQNAHLFNKGTVPA